MTSTERILNALPTGEDNAIPLNEIYRISDTTNSRATRMIIENLRRNGTIICSSKRGYYYPADITELRRYVNKEHSRAASISATIEPAVQLLEEWEADAH